MKLCPMTFVTQFPAHELESKEVVAQVPGFVPLKRRSEWGYCPLVSILLGTRRGDQVDRRRLSLPLPLWHNVLQINQSHFL